MNKQNVIINTIEPSAIFWFAVITMTLFFAASLGTAAYLLWRSPGWSIGDALSEEADPQAVVAPGQKPILIASASRTIAMLGLLVMMGTVVGVSYFALFALFYERSLDNLTKLSPLFYGAAALFAPYAVNQIRGAIAGIGTSAKAIAASDSVKVAV